MSTGQSPPRVREVAPAVHLVTGDAANTYLVEEGGRLTVVDAGTPVEWDLLQRGLALLGRTLADLEAVLLTHAHAGSPGYAERARARTGVRMWIHEADAEVVRADFYHSLMPLLRRGRANTIPGMDISTFSGGENLDVPGHPKAVHVPGHTAGNAAFLLADRRVLLSGHALVTRNPLTGQAGSQIMPPGFNQDSHRARRSLAVLERLAADVVLPGHGEPWAGGAGEAARRARAAASDLW